MYFSRTQKDETHFFFFKNKFFETAFITRNFLHDVLLLGFLYLMFLEFVKSKILSLENSDFCR